MSQTIEVSVESLAKVVAENIHLREQVTMMQRRCGQLLERARTAERRLLDIQEDDDDAK